MKYLLFVLIPVSAFAIQARDLVGDAQKLYEQLGPRDPERRQVSLRYADLLFDAALEIHGDSKSSVKDLDRAETYRRRALGLYQDAQSSMKGLKLLRVKFQISRLHAYAGHMEAANRYWRDLSRQSEDTNIRRESALHLAEQLELSNNRESLNEALKLYQTAMPLAEKQSLRSYIYYRLAWTKFRIGDAPAAVATVRKSIELASPRDYPYLTKDLVLFLSREEKSANDQIKMLTSYERELKMTGLVENLADAYFTADRNADYVHTLKYLNNKNPTAERAIALLDAGHDKMAPKEIRSQLSDIREMGLSSAGNEKKARETLFRLEQYWDGQRRAGRTEFLPVVTDGVSVMISLFPAGDETKKSISGWLAAVTDPGAQMKQLAEWTELKPAAAAELILRQHRLEIARREKVWPVVVEESARLETLASDNRRSVRYQKAKALYELQRYDEALPVFIDLAGTKNVKPDEFTVFSQDLALDIWAKQKNYAAIVLNAAAWSNGARAAELGKIRDQALFEQAAASKNTESLKQFTAFCMKRQFLPQSCDNAKSLAAELRDQNTLIGVLRQQNDESELARQLEIGARFAESARLLEKKQTAPDFMAEIKIAMLYEMQGDYGSRDRMIRRLAGEWKKGKLKLIEDQQNLLMQTMTDAGLIDAGSLSLPWSENLKMTLAAKLFERRPTAEATRVLAQACADYGPGWRTAQLGAIENLNKEQARINFVGANSQAKFQKRVKLLEGLSKQADCFMKGAADADRKLVAAQVGGAYADFSAKILATPVPDGLDATTAQDVKTQITAMAAPFGERAGTWNKVADEISASETSAATKPATAKTKSAPVKFDWQAQLAKLQAQPFSRENVLGLKDHFEKRGLGRLAAYMDGRLQGLERQ